MNVNEDNANNSISVVLSGFGQWAQNKTLLPYLKESQLPIVIRALCNVQNGDVCSCLHALKSSGCCADNISYFDESLDVMSVAKENKEALANILIINTPNAYHFKTIMDAVRNGIHVYVERPIVTPSDDLEILLRTVNASNVIVFTGVQRRLEAPFKYLHEVIRTQRNFGKLSSIRCSLSVGYSLTGWRRDRKLSGGGIILDSGYHLLDISVWLAEAAGIGVPDDLTGCVRFDDFTGNIRNGGVEQTAIGCVTLKENVRLSFDFTYKAPEGSIFERLDIRDCEGTQITLTRDQSTRSSEPGRVRHQKADGTFAIYNEDEINSFDLNDRQLPGKAMNTGPLSAFFEAITGQAQDIGHPCSAEHSLATWRLIKGIYELEKNH